MANSEGAIWIDFCGALLPTWDYPLFPAKKLTLCFHIINPLLTKLHTCSIIHIYYMPSSVSGQEINQILHCYWLPERARWSYLARWGLLATSSNKNFPKSQIINLLLTKCVRSRWLDTGLILFCKFRDLESLSINSQKRTWPISSHLDLTLGW